MHKQMKPRVDSERWLRVTASVIYELSEASPEGPAARSTWKLSFRNESHLHSINERFSLLHASDHLSAWPKVKRSRRVLTYIRRSPTGDASNCKLNKLETSCASGSPSLNVFIALCLFSEVKESTAKA